MLKQLINVNFVDQNALDHVRYIRQWFILQVALECSALPPLLFSVSALLHFLACYALPYHELSENGSYWLLCQATILCFDFVRTQRRVDSFARLQITDRTQSCRTKKDPEGR